MSAIIRVEKFDDRTKNEDGSYSYPPEFKQKVCIACEQPMTRGWLMSNGLYAGVECGTRIEQASLAVAGGTPILEWIIAYETKYQRGINKGIYDFLMKHYGPKRN